MIAWSGLVPCTWPRHTTLCRRLVRHHLPLSGSELNQLFLGAGGLAALCTGKNWAEKTSSVVPRLLVIVRVSTRFTQWVPGSPSSRQLGSIYWVLPLVRCSNIVECLHKQPDLTLHVLTETKNIAPFALRFVKKEIQAIRRSKNSASREGSQLYCKCNPAPNG